MEIIQLMLKLFILKVNYNDPIMVAFEIKSIMDNIQEFSMKPDLPLAKFVNSLYPTHSKYLESLQESDKFKDLTFDTLVENIADKEKAFGNKIRKPTRESLSFSQKEMNHPKDPSKGDSNKRGQGRIPTK